MALTNGGPISTGGAPIGPVIIPTVLQITSDIVNKITHTTCLYDRYWYREEGRITLPLSMFYVKKIQEVRRNDVSQKRVILYERETKAANQADGLREGVMQTITDNIVKHPKVYELDLLIPFQPAQVFSGYVTDITQFVLSFLRLFNPESSALASVNGVLSGIQSVVAMAGKVVDASAQFADGEAQFVNKSSLEAMAESGRILTMKMWYGYYYKYVVVTDLRIGKEPLEDGYFRGNMTVQEMPVLSVTKPEDARTEQVKRNLPGIISETEQSVIVAPLIALTRVRSGSGDDRSVLSGILKDTFF
jgi:hypothetical protein